MLFLANANRRILHSAAAYHANVIPPSACRRTWRSVMRHA